MRCNPAQNIILKSSQNKQVTEKYLSGVSQSLA